MYSDVFEFPWLNTMQEALESIFGPGVGLLGLVFMAVMILPKFLVRWRGFHARKHGPVDCRPRQMGMRRIRGEADADLPEIEVHPEHGEAIACFEVHLKGVLFEGLMWLLPLIITLVCIPADHYSLRGLALVISVPLAFFGIAVLTHCRDRITFYRTGFVLKQRLGVQSIDYNTVIEVTERQAMIPWVAPSQILRLDDDKHLVLNGAYFMQGRRFGQFLARLSPRVQTSAAAETFREAGE